MMPGMIPYRVKFALACLIAIVGIVPICLCIAADSLSAPSSRWPTAEEILARFKDKSTDQIRAEAANGDTVAQHYLGISLATGERQTTSPSEAKDWLQRASDQGFIPATANLGIIHLQGVGTPKNEGKALELFRVAAEAGHAQSQYNLGWMLSGSRGTNQAEAVRWYRRAAEQGHIEAMVALGRCHRFGQGVTKDMGSARRWFERAVEKNDPDGLVNLAWIHAYEPSGNPDKAFDLFRRAAEQGQRDAMYELFLVYRDGRGMDPDPLLARDWLRRSAEAGLPLGQTMFGYWLETKEPASMPEAVRWYRKAEEQGWDGAMYRLGLCYLNGLGVELDEERALALIRNAADMDHPYALFKLAELYGSGVGEPRTDKDRPVDLLDRAALSPNLSRLVEKVREEREGFRRAK